MRVHTVINTVIFFGLVSTLFLGVLIFTSGAIIYTNDTTNSTNNSILLLLYNNNVDNSTIQQIIAERSINTLPDQLAYLRIQNKSTLSSITNNNTFMSQVKEYWFVASNMSNITDLSAVNTLLEKLILSNIPGLILTPDIGNLSSQILPQIGIAQCGGDIIDTENSNSTILYPQQSNLSLLLNTNIPNSTSVSQRITIANCTYNSGIYEIAQLRISSNESGSPSTLLVYQPQYKAKLTIGTFAIRSNNNHNTSNYEYETNNQFDTTAQKFFSSQFNGLSPHQSIVQTFTIYKLLALISVQASTGYTGGTGGSSNTGNPFFTFPNFNINFPQWLFPLTIIIALISALLYLLYKFWYAVLGFVIAITTLIYHPYRKLDALDVLKHSTRQKIIDILYEQAEHGETFRNLNKKIKIPVQTLLWHLKILQDFSLIETFKIRRELVIVAQEFVQNFNPLMKELELSFKSPQAQSFRIFLGNLNTYDTFTLENVIKRTNWNRKTAQRHLNYLCKIQILNKDPKTSKYSINSHYYDSIRSIILLNN